MMKRLAGRVIFQFKKLTAVFLCGVMLVSMPIGMKTVCATSTSESVTENSSTTAAAVGTAAQTETTTENIDANGKLGKNSDVGIELTTSITGKANEDVVIQFKLKSNNIDTIKIKSIYPVIDNTFPFETSGDAYKVISSGADLVQQQVLDASYTMHTRSDITTGYHSVRFIGEYTKIAADGTAEDFYVIKTINIYFTSASDSSKPNSGGSDNKKPTTEKEPDDEKTSDSGGGSSFGGGDEGEAVAPKLVISGYDSKPAKIMAGETFTLTIHIQNTSKTTSLCNGKFLIGNEAGTFLPTSGSSSVFIEKIAPGETGDLEIEMKTSVDLAQKNYILVVKGDFDDGRGNNFTSSDSLSIPVYQEVKLGITDVSMTPGSLAIGAEGSLMFTINNKGTAGVYNVNVAVKDDAVSAAESYVGNIAGSSSAYATLNVVGQQDNSDTGMITLEISYEDSEGNTGTMEEKVSCYVGENVEMPEPEWDEFIDDEEEGGLPLWLLILLIIVGIGVVAGIIIFIAVRRKKRMAELLADEDFEEDDFEEDEETDGGIDGDSRETASDIGGDDGEDDIDNESI